MPKSEKYRPSLHLTSSSGWINDPNGLIKFQGRYHQFYQYHPDSTFWGPMHWGHQSSLDLIDWEEHDVALYPDESGMCFSGSAVFDETNNSGIFSKKGGLVALYTSFIESEYECIDGEIDIRPQQHQSLAYSEDGYNWKKFNNGQPVLYSKGNPDFRDPKVFWHDETNAWVMVLASGQFIEIFRSLDLINWVKVSEFGHRYGFHSNGPWECPDLFPLKCEHSGELFWVLIVGIGEGVWAGGSGTQYFVGTFDGFDFTCVDRHDQKRWLDFGRDHYATQSFSGTSADERVISAWMSNHQYAKSTPTSRFRGAMIVPRKLSIRRSRKGSFKLQQTLVEGLYDKFKSCEEVEFVVDSSQPITKSLNTDVALLEFNIASNDSKKIKLSLFEQQELEFIVLQQENKTVVRSIRAASEHQDLLETGFNHDYSVELPKCENLHLRVLLDSGLCTLIVNNTFPFSNLCFPTSTKAAFAVEYPNGKCEFTAKFWTIDDEQQD